MLEMNHQTLDAHSMVSFIQHDLPGLRDGKYRIRMLQKLEDASRTPIAHEQLEESYFLGVSGDRFSFSNPGATLYSVFPPAHACGRYDAVLPSVVFLQTSLPWSRSPLKGVGNTAGTDQGEADVPTWLTILLLDDTDLEGYACSPEPAVATVGDLFLSSDHPDSSLGSHYSYFDTAGSQPIPLPDRLEPGQQLSDTIRILDIPVPLFQDLAPSIADLKYMAHIRRVSLEKKATMKGISDIGQSEGSFSVVFGNRLPVAGRKTYAYVVSLEGMGGFLPGSGVPLDPGKSIRLAVLHSWVFYSTAEEAGFSDRVKALDGGGYVSLPVPAGASEAVSRALRMGFVPMNHFLRSGKDSSAGFRGDKTVSWMRGPLIPYVNKSRNGVTADASDAWLIFDPTSGMFNASYAAAWTLGRALSLENKNFSMALYRWRRQMEITLEKQADHSVLEQCFSRSWKQSANDGDEATRSTADTAPDRLLRKALLSI